MVELSLKGEIGLFNLNGIQRTVGDIRILASKHFWGDAWQWWPLLLRCSARCLSDMTIAILVSTDWSVLKIDASLPAMA